MFIKRIRRWLCWHDFEPQSVHLGTGETTHRCQKCGEIKKNKQLPGA